MKDTAAIKLFGKKIALPENGWIPAVSSSDDSSGAEDGGECCRDRNSAQSGCLGDKKLMIRTAGNEEQSDHEEGKDATAVKDLFEGDPIQIHCKQQDDELPESDHDNYPETPAAIDEENAMAKASSNGDQTDQSDPNNSQEKTTLKKPDKILPCPRCSSMETKFCYYNNYNINQPRHFCKNCQRYWTAGGTMRNVPVGAGRRKNKNNSSSSSSSACHFRHVTIPQVLLHGGIQIDPPNGNFKPNGGTVLSFGQEAPFSESIASVFDLAEKKQKKSTSNCIDDCSSGSSSVTTSNSGARNGFVQEPIMRNLNGYSPQIPCLPGIPFPYAFSGPSGFPPMPFYPPPPYWNCNVPGAWTVPWFPPVTTNSQLGKHTRDGELLLLKPRNLLLEGRTEPAFEQQRDIVSERSVLIPKTLRIDDPDEAAKSSIWATLGIRNNIDDSASRGSLFKGLQPKDDQKKNIITPETPQAALRANPAAFSRSLTFQETSC